MRNKPLSKISSELTQALSNSVLALTVSLEDLLNSDDTEKRFYRKYYMTPEPDGSLAFFKTTDEPEWTDDGYGEVEKLGETFSTLSSFQAIVDDINNNSLATLTNIGTVGEPTYVYYEVEFMHDELRPLFRNHLAGQLWRVPDEYLLKELSGWQVRQIEKWKRWVLSLENGNTNHSPIPDPQLVDALTSSALVLSLQKNSYIHPDSEGLVNRIYFMSELKDGRDVFFLSTDEPVSQSEYWTNCKKLGSAFTAFFSIEDLIYDLNNFSAAANDHSSVHGPPKYVYYDVLFMNDELKSAFREHLNDEVSGYADDYMQDHFDSNDMQRIAYWKY
jgi:hypothetical protein